jgi:hypothetical protein
MMTLAISCHHVACGYVEDAENLRMSVLDTGYLRSSCTQAISMVQSSAVLVKPSLHLARQRKAKKKVMTALQTASPAMFTVWR